MPPEYKNTVLRLLDPETIQRLQIGPINLELRATIESPGDEIRNVFFIESGLGPMTTVFRDGHEVEVGLFGSEGVIGVSAFMGTKKSMNSIYMQVAGNGYMTSVKVAEQEYRRY